MDKVQFCSQLSQMYFSYHYCPCTISIPVVVAACSYNIFSMLLYVTFVWGHLYICSYLQSSYVIVCSEGFASMQMLKLEEQQLLGEASSLLSEVWHLITSEWSRGLSMVYIRYSLETFLSHHCFCLRK